MPEPSAVSPHDRPPFAAWPTQYAIANGTGRLWYVGAGTVCIQITAARGDVAMAKDYVAAIRAIRAMHHDDFVAASGIGMVQDFRSLHLADKEAREYLNAASRRDFARDEQRFNKVAIREELVLLRIALFLHGAAAARFGLLRVESVSDLEAEVEKLGLVPPQLGPDHDERVRAFETLAARLRDA